MRSLSLVLSCLFRLVGWLHVRAGGGGGPGEPEQRGAVAQEEQGQTLAGRERGQFTQTGQCDAISNQVVNITSYCYVYGYFKWYGLSPVGTTMGGGLGAMR